VDLLKISVIGLGYVGLIQAVGMAKLGYDVVGVDIDKTKVDAINNATAPIYENKLDVLLKEVIPKKLKATTGLKDAVLNSDVTFVCVGTPSKKQGEMSLSQLKNVLKQLGELLKYKTPHIIVIKSTVVPGTCENVVIPTLERTSGKTHSKDFSVVMNPEFLREGEAIEDFFNPDRIVIGSTDENALNILKKIFSHKNFFYK